MKQAGGSTHFPYLDHLRVVSALAVVGMHVTLGTLDTVAPLSMLWWIGQWLCHICQCAVPIFVMISGALLLEPGAPGETLKQFYRKRFRRIGTPLIFWTSLYFVCRAVFDHEPVTLGYVTERIWIADPPYHTYYLFLVVWLYAWTPVLRTYVAKTTPQSRWRVVVILFAGASLYALVNPMLWQRGRLLISFYLPYLSFYLCGHELRHFNPQGLKRRHMPGLVLLCAVYVVLQAGTFVDHLGRFQGRCVLGFFSLPVIVMSIGFFWWAKLKKTQTAASGSRWDRLVHRLAPATFGIYLCHVAILIGLREALGGDAEQGGFLAGIVVGTVVAFALSYALTLLLQRIPYLRRLV